MKNPKLRAYRTLASIRLRRHDTLDRQRILEQTTLASLTETAQEKAMAVGMAEQNVTDQIARIANLLVSGNRFQVADYIGQQDYQAWLEAKVVSAQDEQAQADAAVTRQQEVLQQARKEVARNLDRHKRLEENIRQICIDIDVAQMDSDDEEAEEATVNRRKMQAVRAASEARIAAEAQALEAEASGHD